jgi:hypothetical protein
MADVTVMGCGGRSLMRIAQIKSSQKWHFLVQVLKASRGRGYAETARLM